MKSSALLILVVVMTAVSGLSGNAFAQEITIETSAEAYSNRFFGEGALQVIVTDSNAEDDDTIEEISVHIQADPDGESGSSEDILVPETNEGSGRFEFFLVHISATAVGPGDLDAINSAGVEGDGACAANCAPVVTFGSGGDLDIQSDLYERVTFNIVVGNVEVEASYKETIAVLELDRDAYGTTSYVYISVVDQDANLNPFERDGFIVDPDSDPNGDLLVLDGGTFEDIITFRETGDNTAVFEGRYRLGESILLNSESLVLALFDKANYNATLAAPENDYNNIDEISFTVGNKDGTINIGGGQQIQPAWNAILATDKDSYTVDESVHVTITDQDANVNSSAADSIRLQVSSGSNDIEISALETDANTGSFEVDFMLAKETDAGSSAISPGSSVTIVYVDKRPADYFEKVQAGENPEKEFAIEIDIQLPVRTGTEATGVTAPVAEHATRGVGPYAVGDSVTLSISISNNNDQPQSFVALIEVRDNNGVTMFLALQGGTLEPSGSADVGVLWQPDQAGTFKVRTFVVSDFAEEVEVLSPVAASEIAVALTQ